MRFTREQLETWAGREALDVEAEPVGHVVATFVDVDTGAPRWLGVQTGAHGDELTPVPIEGAEPTGRAIRFPHPAGTIRAAPHQPADARLTHEHEHELAVFYGLLDTEPAPQPLAAGGGPGADPAVVQALRAAHALEREALSRLEALQSSLSEIELQHDVARHLHETKRQEAAIAERLKQLEAAPSLLRDLIARGKAHAPSGTTTADKLRDALEFERQECGAYEQLASVASAAGDGATAQLALKIRADEEAMAGTITASLRRMGEPV